MTKSALALAAIALPAAATAAPQIAIAPAGPVVELSVHESVEIAPDTATISAGVTTQAATATDALRQNSAEMQKVVDRIKALGLKDIQTTGVNLSAQYDYDQAAQRPVFRGYQAANRVSVTLRKVGDTGKVLDALVAAGATDLSGPAFSVADDSAATALARTRALARASAQAKAYASALGYSGAKVLAISESIAGGPQPYMAAKAERLGSVVAATAAPVEPGMVSAGVNVTITFELTGPGTATGG